MPSAWGWRSPPSGRVEPDWPGKLSRLEPPEPPNRYERAKPGELIHIDVKKLGRIEKGAGHRVTGKRTRQAKGVGWERVHVCVDDATRIAYVEVHPPLPAPDHNGKAERFIRTMLGGWAYGAIYRDSTERTAALSGWLEFYNWRRPHGSLSHKPPGARLAELNNVAGSYN